MTIASFRGEPFRVQSHTITVGRKTAIYKLPFESAGVASRDMGRAPRRFSIQALLLQSDVGLIRGGHTVREFRNRLLNALEYEGPGMLVHPEYGRTLVVIEDNISITESTEEGGRVTIDFTCWESRDDAKSLRGTKFDTKANLLNNVSALRDAAGISFVSDFLNDLPDFAAVTNLAVLDTIVNDLTKVNQKIGSALDVPAHFASQISRIAEQTYQLINTPQKLYNSLDALIANIVAAVNLVTGRNRTGVGSLSEVISSMAALGVDTDEPPDIDTPSRDGERSNRANLLIAFRASGLASAAAAAAEATYTSADEANEILQTLVDAVSELSDNTISGIEPAPEVYDALRDVLSALTNHLKSVAGALPELTTFTPAETLPLIVIAYQLYGDATRFDEILARNPQIVNPNLVPAGEPLEILAP